MRSRLTWCIPILALVGISAVTLWGATWVSTPQCDPVVCEDYKWVGPSTPGTAHSYIDGECSNGPELFIEAIIVAPEGCNSWNLLSAFSDYGDAPPAQDAFLNGQAYCEGPSCDYYAQKWMECLGPSDESTAGSPYC
jgi:hypothetical protein